MEHDHVATITAQVPEVHVLVNRNMAAAIRFTPRVVARRIVHRAQSAS